MSRILEITVALSREARRIPLLWAAAGAGVLTVGVVAMLVTSGSSSAKPVPYPEKRFYVEVKRVLSGHSAKLEPEGRLVYAGIRTPYKDEPFYEEAKRRNIELVEGKTLRLRFDVEEEDAKARQLAYAFERGTPIAETLVREGLAYVRLTPKTQRYASELLAAQADARRAKRGIWSVPPNEPETKYPADPKYGNFHRPACKEVAKIKPERLVTYRILGDALDRGLAPCSKCRP